MENTNMLFSVKENIKASLFTVKIYIFG